MHPLFGKFRSVVFLFHLPTLIAEAESGHRLHFLRHACTSAFSLARSI
jgi:hypothetical protein